MTDSKSNGTATNRSRKKISSKRSKPHTCYTCMSKFSNLEDLELHKYTHSDSDVEQDVYLETYYLSALYEGSINAADNIATITNKDEINLNLFKSNINKKEGTSTEESKKFDLKESTNIDNWKCLVHKEVFKNCEDLVFHEENGCNFNCTLCERNFNRKQFLSHILHHTKESSTKEVLFNCKLCAYKFPSLSRLVKHKKYHDNKKNEETKKENFIKTVDNRVPDDDNDVNKTFTCHLCYDVFNSRNDLREHKNFHREINPNQEEEKVTNVIDIDDDNNKFETKALNSTKELDVSVNLISSSIDAKKESLKNYGIYFEETIVINDSDEENVVENFIAKCDDCGKVFYENDSVINHSKNRCKCKDCSKQICTTEELKKHYINVHKKFFCSTCQYVTKSIEEYEVHFTSQKCGI